MGSVYMAICKYKSKTYIKFGMSHSDNPTRRSVRGLKRKFDRMTHKCYACYTSKYHLCIEAYLHAQLAKKRTNDIWSHLDGPQKSVCSIEHYEISIATALNAFKKAIVKIEESSLKIEAPCPLSDGGCSYRLTKGKVNTRLKITEKDIKAERNTR